MDGGTGFDRQAVYDELARVRAEFRGYVDGMGPEDMLRRTDGTRWTNREMLFHMLFGYFVVRRLMWMVKGMGYLPEGASRPFAGLLDVGTRPFDAANYFGSWGGGRTYSPAHLVSSMDKVTSRLAGQLARESEANLRRGMHYPQRWDPFFKDWMTLADLYHYPTQHFDFHARQLSL